MHAAGNLRDPPGVREETPGHKVPDGLLREVSSQFCAKYAACELIRHRKEQKAPESAAEL